MKVVLFSLLMSISLSAIGQSGLPLQLVEPTDIKDIERLDYEVVRLNAKVRQCVAAGLAPVTECHCFYPGKLAAAINLYRTVVEKHPEWENRAVLWWDSARSIPSNLHMGGLRRTIERSCQSLVSR